MTLSLTRKLACLSALLIGFAAPAAQAQPYEPYYEDEGRYEERYDERHDGARRLVRCESRDRRTEYGADNPDLASVSASKTRLSDC